MNTNKQSSNRNDHKKEKDSSGVMKFFYLIMLLLIVSSSVLSVLGARRRTSSNNITSTPDSVSVGGGGMAAINLKFHREDIGANVCEDLVITSAGDAIYSDCAASTNLRYTLNDIERTQLDGWIQSFKQINYDNTDQQGNMTIQLFLNGQGNQPLNNTATQQLINFATALVAKIAAMS